MQSPKVWSKRWVILLGLILTSILVRIITAEYIDIGGDNSGKWLQAHYLLEQGGFISWSQQTSRWGIVLPLAALMKLFGFNPVSMYIQPILFSTLGVACLYLIGEHLRSRTLGILAAFCAIIFPQMAQTGSQLWPSVFEFCCISLCILLIIHFQQTQKPSILLLASLVFFFGWGCRVTMIYAAPGMALLIWLPARNFKALCSFFVPLACLFFLEWGIFWVLTDNPLGRIGVIRATHVAHAVKEISFTDYLLNIKYGYKLKGLLPIWVLCLVAAGAQIYKGKGSLWRPLGLLYVIHVFLLVYMVSSVNPIKMAMPFSTRFWGAIAPVGILLLLHSLLDLKRVAPRTVTSLITVLLIVFSAFSAKKIPPTNSLVQLNHDYHLVSSALNERKPILLEYEHWQPNFMEEKILTLFTGKKGNRTPSDKAVIDAMMRNRSRIVALFETDLSKHKNLLHPDRLVPIGKTTYLFVLPGASRSAPHSVKINYGYKLHAAHRVPET